MQGGALVRLFHKDLEAYLTAEGVFGEDPTEKGKVVQGMAIQGMAVTSAIER